MTLFEQLPCSSNDGFATCRGNDDQKRRICRSIA
jgi:hypothetical protein